VGEGPSATSPPPPHTHTHSRLSSAVRLSRCCLGNAGLGHLPETSCQPAVRTECAPKRAGRSRPELVLGRKDRDCKYLRGRVCGRTIRVTDEAGAQKECYVRRVVARQGQEAGRTIAYSFNGISYVKTLLGRRIQELIVWLLFNDDSSAAEVVWRRGSISKLGGGTWCTMRTREKNKPRRPSVDIMRTCYYYLFLLKPDVFGRL
jgi:hypothetical protein